MTVKEYAEKYSPCPFYERESVGSRLIDDGVIDIEKWEEVIAHGDDNFIHDYLYDLPLFEIIEEGMVIGCQKFLEPYLDENGELDEKTKDEIDDDYDLCQKGEEIIYQCVKELMTKEFPKLIESYEE